MALYGLVTRDVDEHRARLVGVATKVADRIAEQERIGGIGQALRELGNLERRLVPERNELLDVIELRQAVGSDLLRGSERLRAAHVVRGCFERVDEVAGNRSFSTP